MKQTIQVIQGDTLNLKVSVSSSHDLIDQVFFSCADLNLVQELLKVEKDNEVYWLLTIKDTSDLKPCYTTFDITMKINGDETLTTVHNGDLNILAKGNTIYARN